MQYKPRFFGIHTGKPENTTLNDESDGFTYAHFQHAHETHARASLWSSRGEGAPPRARAAGLRNAHA